MCGQNGIKTTIPIRDISSTWILTLSYLQLFGFWFLFFSTLIEDVISFRNSSFQPRLDYMPSSSVALAIEYLNKYGYLPYSEFEASNLRTEERLQEAIRTMQRFGNVPETGIIDDETYRLMKRRRCGVADLMGNAERVKRYALQGQRWSGTNLTWSVKEPVEKTDLSMVRRQLAKAFNVWADASILSFTEVRGSKADIVVSFLHGSHGDGYPFDGEGSVLAHAFFPGEGIGGDAHFDAEERWLPQQPLQDEDGVNLFAVAAHEIGHSLGLSHSSAPGSLMFPYYQMVDGYFKLPEDDTIGIQQLYGSQTTKKWATMPNMYPTSSSTTPVTTRTPKRYTKKPTSATKRRKGASQNGKTSTSTSVYSTREEIKPTTILPPTTTMKFDHPPDPCNTSIDAIAVIRREIFLFKDKYFWRLNQNQTVKKGYPAPINRFWHDLPSDIQKVDAVYERPFDTKIVFFIGKQYWLFVANQLEEGYPQPITNLGLPPYLRKIDAVFVWGHNGKTYLLSGNHYWKLEENHRAVELDYPRDIKTWRGIPNNIDAAFQGLAGDTYFFKEKQYWKFNDLKMRVQETDDASELWFGCSQKNEQKLYTSNMTEKSVVLPNYQHSGQKMLTHFGVVIFLSLILSHFVLET